jgi:hypothetical protein
MTAIIPGTRFHGFEVLSVDPNGERVCVSCPCRAVHIFSVEALLNNTASCIAVKPTTEQMNAGRNEKARAQYQRRSGQQDWRPGR